jgi:translation initiation factor IF-3
VPQIRLIGAGGEQLGIVTPQEGLRIAQESGLDLVEVAPTVSPPVCRVMDYSKYKYEQEKKERQAHKHQKIFQTKEIKIKPNIEEHDYQVKLAYLKKFLTKGHRVKVTLTYRGREMAHQEIGRRVLERLTNDALVCGIIEKPAVTEGRNVIMIFAPK